MFCGNFSDYVRQAPLAVARQWHFTTKILPHRYIRNVPESVRHHLVVVAAQEYDVECCGDFQQSIDHTFYVRAFINVVA